MPAARLARVLTLARATVASGAAPLARAVGLAAETAWRRTSPADDAVRHGATAQALGALLAVQGGATRLYRGGTRLYALPEPLWETPASLRELDGAPALDLIDRTLAILNVVVPPPPPPPPPPDPDPDPDPPPPPPPPPPQPSADWKVIDAGGGVADLRDWTVAVGAKTTVAYVRNATTILFWQWADRCRLWKRADGRYQIVEVHATGQTFVAEPGLTAIAWGGREAARAEPIANFLTAPTGRPEPVPPAAPPTIPATFPPNQWGFGSTEGLDMKTYEEVIAFLNAAKTFTPAQATTCQQGLAVAGAIANYLDKPDDKVAFDAGAALLTALAAGA